MRTARLLTASQHALPRGGVCIPACTGQGGVCPGGSAQGSLPRGCLPGGCLLGGWQTPPTPCEQNDRQTGVKTLPCRNFVEGGNHRHRKLVRLCATITNHGPEYMILTIILAII